MLADDTVGDSYSEQYGQPEAVQVNTILVPSTLLDIDIPEELSFPGRTEAVLFLTPLLGGVWSRHDYGTIQGVGGIWKASERISTAIKRAG